MGSLRFVVFAFVVGCTKPQPGAGDAAPIGPAHADSTEDARDTWAIPHRVAGTWTGEGGVTWEAIVVRPGLPHPDVVRLARALRAEKPTTFFDIYDDDTELPALVAASGNDDALPKKWREAHAVGTVAGAVTVTDGGPTIRDMQLIEWRSFRTTKL